MKNARFLPILFLALSGCAPTRPNQPTATDESEYFVANTTESPGMSRLGQKRLLPDPHGGLGTTNDLTLRVTDIQLTKQYTVLFLTFGEDRQPSNYQSGGSSISFNSDARLLAGPDHEHLKTFRFVKAEGIVLSPESQTVQVGEQVKFRLYFERLDKGTEEFSLFECEDTKDQTCWNVRGMHISNPADSATAPNRR